MTKHVAILGAGFAGLAAAQRCRQLGAAVAVYEKNACLGGHASSMVVNGFTFDEGPHVSFTKKDVIKELLARGVGGDYREFGRARWPAGEPLPPVLCERVLPPFVYQLKDWLDRLW